MYKIELNLKQHTPIIHFQHYQDGATLRGTEVKPKLDAFIIKHMGKGDYNAGLDLARKNGFLVENNDKCSLNYKLKITINGDPEKYFLNSNPPSNQQDESRKTLVLEELKAEYINKTQYFANNSNLLKDKIKDIEEVKLGVLGDLVTITFIFQNKNLNELLKAENSEILNSFFCSTTFGSRQTKGFGVFLPERISKADFIKLLKNDSTILGVFTAI